MPTQLIADIKGFRTCLDQLDNELIKANSKLAQSVKDLPIETLAKTFQEIGIHVANIVILGNSLTDILHDLESSQKIDKSILKKIEKIIGRIIYMGNHGTVRSSVNSLRIISKRFEEMRPDLAKLPKK